MVGHRNQISVWPQLVCPCALGQLLRVSAGVLATFGGSHRVTESYCPPLCVPPLTFPSRSVVNSPLYVEKAEGLFSPPKN